MASKRKAPAASNDDGAGSGSAGRPSGGAASTAEVDYVLPDVKKRNPISQAIYTYNMWTGLYMLDPWEKFLFSEFTALGQVCAVGEYARHISIKSRRSVISLPCRQRGHHDPRLGAVLRMAFLGAEGAMMRQL